MSIDYYKVLGVSIGATQQEIRSAYFQLVRQYPPEKDPENFKKIRTAYEVLFNPERKKEYDALLENENPQVSEWFQLANDFVEEGRLGDAVKLLHKILAIVPTSGHVLNLLGLCYAYADLFDDSLQTFRKLLLFHEDNGFYWNNYANVLNHIRKKGLDEVNKNIDEIRDAYLKAVKLENDNVKYYLDLIEFLQSINDDTSAEFWINELQEKVKVDNEYYLEIKFNQLKNYISNLNLDKLKIMIDDQTLMRSISPAKLAELGNILFQAVNNRINQIERDKAVAFLSIALKLAPEQKEIAETYEVLFEKLNFKKEIEAFHIDTRIMPELKDYIDDILAPLYGKEPSESMTYRSKLFESITSIEVANLQRQLEIIKLSYKKIYSLTVDYLEELKEAVGLGVTLIDRLDAKQKREKAALILLDPQKESNVIKKPVAKNKAPGPGCSVIVVIIIVIAVISVIMNSFSNY